MKSPIRTLVITMLMVASISGPGRAQAAEFLRSEYQWRTATPSQIERLLVDGADINLRDGKFGEAPCTEQQHIARA